MISPASPFSATVASSSLMKQTLPSRPKRMTSPVCKFLRGLRQRAPVRTVEALDQGDRNFRFRSRGRGGGRSSCAAITLRVVDDERDRRRAAGPADRGCCDLRVPAGAPARTTSSRAASRGSAGRSAMRSGGSSKSNRSVRIDHARVARRRVQRSRAGASGATWRRPPSAP